MKCAKLSMVRVTEAGGTIAEHSPVLPVTATIQKMEMDWTTGTFLVLIAELVEVEDEQDSA